MYLDELKTVYLNKLRAKSKKRVTAAAVVAAAVAAAAVAVSASAGVAASTAAAAAAGALAGGFHFIFKQTLDAFSVLIFNSRRSRTVD